MKRRTFPTGLGGGLVVSFPLRVQQGLGNERSPVEAAAKLPVELPSRFYLVIDRKTARALGTTLRRACCCVPTR